MRVSFRAHALVMAATCTALGWVGAPVMAAQRERTGTDRIPPADTVRSATVRSAYERGYREGIERGERDGREQREFGYERDDWYRDGERGYKSIDGSRDAYRTEYRRGFAAGYRDGYARFRVVPRDRRDGRFDNRGTRGYLDPAAARGYSDGYAHGFDDGDDRDRFDPSGHGDYREADQGYHREYGSRTVYQDNYRAGFRPGYEDGFRDGSRR